MPSIDLGLRARRESFAAERTLWLLGLGTALSLLGDTTLYVALPTRTAQAGILLADVGLMLSANRAVRIFLNSPYGVLIERLPRRRVLVPSLCLGALVNLLYAVPGFWPLLVGRLLWGWAWAGIWLGGSTAVLDLAAHANRGRLVGRYQMWSFVGLGAGALLGGVCVDWLGYRSAFVVFALVTSLAALMWWAFLPETRQRRAARNSAPAALPAPPTPRARAALVTAMLVLGLNWLVFLGALGAVLPLLLQQRIGDAVALAGVAIPLTTLTGAVAAANQVLSLVASPVAGWLSDRRGNRWGLVILALVLGVASLVMAAEGVGAVVIAGLLLSAVATGVLQTQAITLAGDHSGDNRQGRVLGVLNAVGDLGSAAGPLLAFALLPFVDLRGVCLLAAALLAVVLPWVSWLAWREVRLARAVRPVSLG
ncbi:MAG: MFS transporter [Anaerolineae bacterium]|nr:MFS transporter [Anaerolineae bacterium]